MTSLRVPAPGAEGIKFQFENGAFRGAATLTDLWLYESDATAVIPPSGFHGVADAFRVHVPTGSFYAEDYNWSPLKLTYVYDAD